MNNHLTESEQKTISAINKELSLANLQISTKSTGFRIEFKPSKWLKTEDHPVNLTLDCVNMIVEKAKKNNLKVKLNNTGNTFWFSN